MIAQDLLKSFREFIPLMVSQKSGVIHLLLHIRFGKGQREGTSIAIGFVLARCMPQVGIEEQ
jgi:hypothetical protein